MSDELKPCPFCGGKAKLIDESEECSAPTFIIQCQSNTCFFSMAECSPDVVTEGWNTRVVEDALRRQLDEAQAQVLLMRDAIKDLPPNMCRIGHAKVYYEGELCPGCEHNKVKQAIAVQVPNTDVAIALKFAVMAAQLSQEREARRALEITLKDLADEADRVFHANLEDGRNLVHLGRSISNARDILSAAKEEPKVCKVCGHPAHGALCWSVKNEKGVATCPCSVQEPKTGAGGAAGT